MTKAGEPRRSPGRWLRTVRGRLTLTYSSIVFGITAVILVTVYRALNGSRPSTAVPPPGDPVGA